MVDTASDFKQTTVAPGSGMRTGDILGATNAIGRGN